MAGKVEVFEVCPLLIPQDSSFRRYEGYITVCERLLQSKNEERIINHPKYYTQLIEEMEAISWDKLVYIDPSFTSLKLMAKDNKKRDHFLTIKLSPQHPNVPPTCTTDLPGKFSFSWTSSKDYQLKELHHQFEQHPNVPPTCTTDLPGKFSFSWTSSKDYQLKELHHQFEQALTNYQEFWDMMDEIDQNTWVLEPDHPQRACTTRRIALGNNSSIHIDINPLHPRLLPECRFLGADHVIIPLRENLNSNLNLWNPESSVFINLQNLLKLKFPSPTNTKKEDFSMECGICYAYRLNDAIPDKACDDSRCGQPFHQLCLIEWLKSLPSSRQSFNMIFGECPYCNKPITVKVTGTR
ncbi:E3 ubiquitin-protein ligase FANCL [Exaiptasia diaphana]|nr:E3 ubiquitin-protein ligase FANCL [Exaiptasia diaphana]